MWLRPLHLRANKLDTGNEGWQPLWYCFVVLPIASYVIHKSEDRYKCRWSADATLPWLLLPMKLVLDHAHSASATHYLHACTAPHVHAWPVPHIPSSSWAGKRFFIIHYYFIVTIINNNVIIVVVVVVVVIMIMHDSWIHIWHDAAGLTAACVP